MKSRVGLQTAALLLSIALTWGLGFAQQHSTRDETVVWNFVNGIALQGVPMLTPVGSLTLDGLTDVDATSPLPMNGYVLTYDENLGIARWKYPTPPNPSTTGIRTTPTKIQSLLFESTPVSGNIVLCVHSLVPVIVGALGASLTLPSAADDNCGGEFELIIDDDGAGFMTLVPNGLDEIGIYGNASPPPITGKGSRYVLRRITSNRWDLKMTSRSIFGALGGMICQTGPGSTNNSSSGSGAYLPHSLTCTILENTLKAGSVFEGCSIWRLVTGSAPGVLGADVVANSAVSLIGPGIAYTPAANITNHIMTSCFSMLVGAVDPSNGNALMYAGPVVPWGAPGTDTNPTPTVTLSIWNDLVVSWFTYWASAGTGPNTIQQLGIYGRLTNP